MERCPRCGKMTAEYYSDTDDYKCFNGDCYEKGYTFTSEESESLTEQKALCWYTGQESCSHCVECTSEITLQENNLTEIDFKILLKNFKEYLKTVAKRDNLAGWNGNSTGKIYIADGETVKMFLEDIEKKFEEISAEIDYENTVIHYKPDKKYTVKGIFSEYEAEIDKDIPEVK